MAKGRGLTKERWKQAVRAYSRCGIYARVAEALGVDDETLRNWRHANPEFQADLDEAERRYDRSIGELARTALQKDLDAYIAGEPVLEEVMNAKGDIATLKKPRHLNIAAVRTGLTKMDREWTHPKVEVEHSGRIAFEKALDAIPDD